MIEWKPPILRRKTRRLKNYYSIRYIIGWNTGNWLKNHCESWRKSTEFCIIHRTFRRKFSISSKHIKLCFQPTRVSPLNISLHTRFSSFLLYISPAKLTRNPLVASTHHPRKRRGPRGTRNTITPSVAVFSQDLARICYGKLRGAHGPRVWYARV